MHSYFFEQITKTIAYQKCVLRITGIPIRYLAFDSRYIVNFSNTLFFALKNKNRHGHIYVNQLYEKGVKNFVVEPSFDSTNFPDANFLFVENPLATLQDIVLQHRNQFNLQTIGIVGSNGKTIVKEWLSQMLASDYDIVKTPQSFNSQIGVPISLWNISTTHNLGIFEAGISRPNEMQILAQLIQPNIGILTNIGEAHQENFNSTDQKIEEKCKLFVTAEVVIYDGDDVRIEPILSKQYPHVRQFTFGFNERATVLIKSIVQKANNTECTLIYQQKECVFVLPFTDKASIQNAFICICVLFYFNQNQVSIQEKINRLSTLPMRLSVMQGKKNCTLINDTYSNDSNALTVALQYLQQRSEHIKRSAILSDIVGTQNAQAIADLINEYELDKFIGIGETLFADQHLFLKKNKNQIAFFRSTQSFIAHIHEFDFTNELILLKGARQFEFEKLLEHFKQNIHETILEINLSHLKENVQYIQQHIGDEVKIMAVVKAFAYGSGSVEVARVLEKSKVDYLAVAYIDEGIQLREAGIITPIMVMNCNEKVFEFLIQYRLEPELFSFEIFHAFVSFLSQKNIHDYPIHLKIDTGMNRLGFKHNDIDSLLIELKRNKNHFRVASAFSHLVGSEDPALDGFSNQQAQQFIAIATQIEKTLGYSIIQHIANSSAALRHKHLALNMVRLGIAMYGISPDANNVFPLQNVLTLKTSIAQIKDVEIGETIGYNRKGKVQTKTRIAVIRTGYAEGFMRTNGNGNGQVLIHHQLALTIGNVCMDMTMIDISNMKNVVVGNEVILFGKDLPVHQVAKWNGTIAHELIANISQRVRREYVY